MDLLPWHCVTTGGQHCIYYCLVSTMKSQSSCFKCDSQADSRVQSHVAFLYCRFLHRRQAISLQNFSLPGNKCCFSVKCNIPVRLSFIFTTTTTHTLRRRASSTVDTDMRHLLAKYVVPLFHDNCF